MRSNGNSNVPRERNASSAIEESPSCRMDDLQYPHGQIKPRELLARALLESCRRSSDGKEAALKPASISPTSVLNFELLIREASDPSLLNRPLPGTVRD